MLSFAWDYTPFDSLAEAPTFDASTGAMVSSSFSSAAAAGYLDAHNVYAGAESPMFVKDFYDRIHITTLELDLGNVITNQVRTIALWNAYRRAQTLQSLTLENVDGISLTGQSDPPLVFGPLQERSYTLTVETEGAAIINSTITWDFGDISLALHITGSRITAWTWEPDWSQRMVERLEWRTDVIQSFRGEEQRRALRLGPRQQIEFAVSAEGDDRRHMEAVLWNWGARMFAVPLWFDGVQLDAALSSGATSIPLDPSLRQFAVGELVMILGDDSRTAEVIEIAALGSSIDLVTATTLDWPAGSRVFPARTARIDGDLSIPRFTGRASSVKLRFEMTDPATWTADAGATTYRGYPVLEDVPDWSEDPELGLERKVSIFDAGTGLVTVDDEAEMPLARQRGNWTLVDRAEIDAWRKRLFALRGKHGGIWVPTWSEDLVPVATVSSVATTIDVAWTGFTRYLQSSIDRQDIRIQLVNGTVLYRRITGSSVVDTNTERLSIDSALGVTVPVANFALVSWLALVRQESDASELAWFTGDVVETATTFRGFRE